METDLEYSKEAGIYKLTCSDTGKVYIGKTINFSRRLKEHKNCEKQEIGKCYLQYVIMKHGWSSFTVDILETFENFDKLKDNNALLERESFYINLFDSTNLDKGYNLCKYSSDRTGTICSDESKLKMSVAQRGRIITEDHKDKLRKNRIGKSMSNESKEKIRQARIGKKHSKESKEKMSSQRKGRVGYKVSEETKEKMRQAKIGRPCSEETKIKIGLANSKKQYHEF